MTTGIANVDVKSIFENAMVNLIIEFPVFATLVTRIGCKLVNEPGVKVAAWFDGHGIYVNEAVIAEFNQNPIDTDNHGKSYNRLITQKEMQFLICHELMHLLTLSFERDRNVGLDPKVDHSPEAIRKYQIWNAAQDYEINSLLHNNEETDSISGDQKRKPVGNMPEWVCYDSKYIDWIAEDIYKDLIENEKRNNGGQLMQPVADGDPFAGNDKDGMVPLDRHTKIEDGDVRNEVISKIAEVFGSKGNGTGQSAIDRAVERTFKPQPFNWRKALAKYMRKFVKENYSWNKPSRAGIANNLILPSNGTAPKLNIGVAVDTSGSISDKEINTMMDHLYTILQQFKSFEIDLWSCGSVVYEDTLIKITNQNKRDLVNFQVKSDGGNDMRQNFKFIKKYYKGRNKIDLLIIMSDFIDPLDGDTETTSICPCIFMCIDHKDFKKPTKIKGEVYPFSVEDWKN